MALACFVGLVVSRGLADEPASSRMPNVVIMFTDDQGYGDLGCQGHPTIATPNIDRLAAEGARLTQFYVASPVCSPSRAALMTGCYPKRVGMHRHVVFPPDDHGLHTDEDTIADVLGRAGYATGCFGKWHLGHRRGHLPTDQGFDTFVGVPYSNDMSQFHRPDGNNYRHSLPFMVDDRIVEWEPDQRLLTRRVTEAAIAFIEKHADRPFLAYIPHSMPHIPLYASASFEGTSRRGLYGDVIEEIDWSMGQVMAELDRLGLRDDTIVIFTSDNGPWLPFKQDGGSAGLLSGGKGTNREGGQRVPCVIRHPGVVPPGLVVRDVATTMDLLPTIAAWCGVPVASDRMIDGRDVRGLLTGDSADSAMPTGDEWSFLYYTSRGELAGIRRGRWKLLLESNALYDLDVDPSEAWDLSSEHPELIASLRTQAESMDREIEAAARPPLHVADPLWDPATVVRPRTRPNGG